MKRAYVRPTMVGERFVANEYVAACGDKGTVDGVHNENDKVKFLGAFYHPCGIEHEASTTDTFYDGFVDYNWNGKQDSGEGVIVWRGPRNNNGHATTNLDMNTWETAKS